MAAYCAASSSWRSAKPTVRNSAKISNPSKVHPRFEASSTFHWSRFSKRYHGRFRVDSWIDIDAPSPVHPRLSHAREAIGPVGATVCRIISASAIIPSPIGLLALFACAISKKDPGEGRDPFVGRSCAIGDRSRPSPGPMEDAAEVSAAVEGGHDLAGEPLQLLDELARRQAFGPVDHEILEAGVFRLDRFDAVDDLRRRAAEPRLLLHPLAQGRHRRRRARRAPGAALLVGVTHHAVR